MQHYKIDWPCCAAISRWIRASYWYHLHSCECQATSTWQNRMESHQVSRCVYLYLFPDTNNGTSSMQLENSKDKIPKFSNKEKQVFTEGLLKPLMDYHLAIEPLQRMAQSSSPPLSPLSLQEPDPLATRSSVSQSPSPLSLLTSFDKLGNFTPQTTPPAFSTQPSSPITTPTPQACPHPHPCPIPTFTEVPDELLLTISSWNTWIGLWSWLREGAGTNSGSHWWGTHIQTLQFWDAVVDC